jgi:hypothetical protein
MRSSKTRPQSQGGKVVTCVRCKGDIQPYAGREVANGKFAHHPGQCSDVTARDALPRELAGQGTLFGWRCDHVSVDAGQPAPEVCAASGTDRTEYAAHMKSHGARPLTAPKMIRLRKSAPAASLTPAEVPPFEWLHWTETHITGPWAPGTGQPSMTAERRGQFWSEGPYPHSVWVLPLEPAPWEIGQAAPVTLFVIEPGRYTTDWSEARQERREAKRRGARYAPAA